MVKNKITTTFLPFDLRDKGHRFGPDQDQNFLWGFVVIMETPELLKYLDY